MEAVRHDDRQLPPLAALLHANLDHRGVPVFLAIGGPCVELYRQAEVVCMGRIHAGTGWKGRFTHAVKVKMAKCLSTSVGSNYYSLSEDIVTSHVAITMVGNARENKR
jgi:hypothetical protein